MMVSTMCGWKQILKTSFGLVATISLVPAIALAAQSTSNNYQVNEVFFGSGGELNACSTNYCSKQAAGDLAVGNTASPNYQAQAGFNTDRQPFIEFTVSNTNVDLGKLSTSTTKTATANFTIKAYLAHGYTVVNASDPPVNNGYQMQAITTAPTAASAGTEQFGINLVSNTSPVTFGADRTFTPDSTFSSGLVAPDYSNHDLFIYRKNDVIAYSNASSSYTNYTVSYIFNISSVTPGGTYELRHVLVATATY
ncbi:MAG: hypothetical protein ABIV43_01450 [Candidatus Saccharimonadales bacterium]